MDSYRINFGDQNAASGDSSAAVPLLDGTRGKTQFISESLSKSKPGGMTQPQPGGMTQTQPGGMIQPQSGFTAIVNSGVVKEKRYRSPMEYGITKKQMDVLEWLVDKCKNKDMIFNHLYADLSHYLKVSKIAARKRVEALAKKKFLTARPLIKDYYWEYGKCSRVVIGTVISIHSNALVKVLPHVYKHCSTEEHNANISRIQQGLDLVRKGYDYIPEVGGYVKCLPRPVEDACEDSKAV